MFVFNLHDRNQGYNTRKVTLEVYTSFDCSLLSLANNVNNTRRMSKPDMGYILHVKKSMKYSGHRKLLCEFSNFLK